jgi:ketosteroid isomerase-like protein
MGAIRAADLAPEAMATALSADVEAIERQRERFCEAFRIGNEASVAQLYTEDAVLLPPDAKLIRGAAAIQMFWRANAGQMQAVLLMPLDLRLIGSDGAWEVGTFTVASAGSLPEVYEGKYVIVWQKVGVGDWRIATDIWNMTA